MVLNILKNFSKVLGQKINFDKSMICFSLNTPVDQRHFYSDLFGMKVVNELDNYLGLPLPVGKKKYVAFHNIINRFSCRINNWSMRLLSYGGKEIFIKSIL